MPLDTVIPPPIVGAATAAAIWKVAQKLPEYSTRALLAPDVAAKVLQYTPYVAGGLAVVGLGLDIAAILSFNANRTSVTPLTPASASCLVTDGLYSFTRNPMYLGVATILAAWSTYLEAPVVGLVGIGAFVTYITQFQIKPEETALARIFPVEYPDYKKRVARWIIF